MSAFTWVRRISSAWEERSVAAHQSWSVSRAAAVTAQSARAACFQGQRA